MSGIFLGFFMKEKMDPSHNLSIRGNNDLKYEGLNQLLEESVLVRDDLERLLAEATRLSKQIVDELSTKADLFQQSPKTESYSTGVAAAFENASDETSNFEGSNQEPVVIASVQWPVLEELVYPHQPEDWTKKDFGWVVPSEDPHRLQVVRAEGVKHYKEQAGFPSKMAATRNMEVSKQSDRIDVYDQICIMADAGFSVAAIAQKMELGLGEVQLVLQIYRKSRYKAG
jgi:hypothetical protein